MPAEWTGNLLGDMHNNGVTRVELAKELNCTKAYVSMVLNGQKTPSGGKERFYSAYYNIMARRKTDGPGV